jgi:2-polyprenyl-6-methoxyphenol hydroxylase-like FAD-dependent oxidoreductase
MAEDSLQRHVAVGDRVRPEFVSLPVFHRVENSVSRVRGLPFTDQQSQQASLGDRARGEAAVAYRSGGWHLPDLPDLLDRLRAATDLYFDAVCQVRLPAWSQGRVALVGDAAATVSLFGDGSSLAMIGAYTLAEALAVTPDDHASALRSYETRHRALAHARQRGYTIAAALLVPTTRAGITVRNLAARLLAPTNTQLPPSEDQTTTMSVHSTAHRQDTMLSVHQVSEAM